MYHVPKWGSGFRHVVEAGARHKVRGGGAPCIAAECDEVG